MRVTESERHDVRGEITAADVRAEVARCGTRIYELAPLVGLHPSLIGGALSGRVPMSQELARKIIAAAYQCAEWRVAQFVEDDDAGAATPAVVERSRQPEV